jgi:hypothetical protein
LCFKCHAKMGPLLPVLSSPGTKISQLYVRFSSQNGLVRALEPLGTFGLLRNVWVGNVQHLPSCGNALGACWEPVNPWIFTLENLEG